MELRCTRSDFKRTDVLPPMRIDPTKPCFLDLPGEIRNQIYDHIRKNHFEDIRRNPRQPDVYNNVFGRYRNILKLNKTIHREAASWLWGNYVVSIHKDIVNLESFLRVMPTNASYVEDIALVDFFGMGSNQSPVQDWKKRRWSMVEIHEAHSNTLASLQNLQRIWFRWDTHYIDLDYLSWCIHITIRKWMARFGNAEDQSVALESHVRLGAGVDAVEVRNWCAARNRRRHQFIEASSFRRLRISPRGVSLHETMMGI
ncbi:hypothetical protein SLS57_003949 [Botryosphaeria dothidea]